MKLLALAAALAMACGGQVNSTPDAAPATLDGTWVGYLENYKFPSGSDAVTLTLTNNAGVLTGTASFGNGPAPPPPTDPNAAYPPGFTGGMQFTPSLYMEGFVFTVLDGTFDGSRVQLGVQSTEVFKLYCGLQTQIWGQASDGGAPYACLPNWGFLDMNGSCSSTNPRDPTQIIAYPCEKLALCNSSVCQCTQTSCALPVATPTIHFDMVFTPGSLDGSIAGDLGSVNVHLKKQ